MIRCTLATIRGIISRFESSGHGSVDNPEARVSISCAAVSALIRSMGTLVEKSDCVSIELIRFQPGDIAMRVGHVDENAEEWLRGLTDMLAQGLEDVRRDYPDQIEFLRTAEEHKGDSYGS